MDGLTRVRQSSKSLLDISAPDQPLLIHALAAELPRGIAAVDNLPVRIGAPSLQRWSAMFMPNCYL